MIDLETTPALVAPRPSPRPYRMRFDWVMIALYSWVLAGTTLDAWAHNQPNLPDSFVSPWHLILYSGCMATGSFLVVTLVGNRLKGRAWRKALPTGYGLSLVGAIIIGVGGGGDWLWHSLFGIENSWQAVFSPSHIALAIGGALLITGPLRSAWTRPGRHLTWRTALPMLLAITFLLSELTLFTWYSHPFGNIYPAKYCYQRYEVVSLMPLDDISALSWSNETFYEDFSDTGDGYYALAETRPYTSCYTSSSGYSSAGAIGTTGMYLQTAVLMGLVLLVLRRWQIPFGSLSLILGFSTALMAFTRSRALEGGPLPWIGVGLAAGLTADILLWRLKPSAGRLGRLRIFAFAMPFSFYLFYYLVVALTAGIDWSIHVWTGTIFICGIIGWLASYLVFPPVYKIPEPEIEAERS